jgi:hypothetical protein
MQRSSFLYESIFILAGALTLGANAHAGPIVNFTNFSEDIVYGTDTFETSAGAVLFTIQFVGWSDEISSDIASQISSDPSFLASAPTNATNPLHDPVATTFIKGSASQAALATDLQFLSGQLPSVFLTSANPTVYVGSPSDVTAPEPFLEALFTGFVVDDPVSVYSLGFGSYNTGALDGPNAILEGTATFDAFELGIVSKPVAATPEPSMLALLGSGLLALTFCERRAAQSRWRSAMKCTIFVLAAAVALVANAQADPIVHTTNFSEEIVVVTDTFETSGGAVLFTTNGVGYSDWLSPFIASDLAGDSTIPAQVQSTASLVAKASEYQVLAEQGPNYLVLNGAGPAMLDPFEDQDIALDVGYALTATGGPGYSMMGSPIITSFGTRSYSTGAVEPDGSILEGTITFDVFGEGIVEQPVATPEPSMLALLGSVLMLILFVRRNAAGGIK